MKPFKRNLTAWPLLVSIGLIASSCASSKRLSEESQRRNTTIAYNAQRISDADAAVACYDMLISAEQRLADTTDAYRNYREVVTPGLEKKARKKGIWIGATGATSLWFIFLLVLK